MSRAKRGDVPHAPTTPAVWAARGQGVAPFAPAPRAGTFWRQREGREAPPRVEPSGDQMALSVEKMMTATMMKITQTTATTAEQTMFATLARLL